MKKIFLHFVFCFFSFSIVTLGAENRVCEEWFRSANLKPGQDCEIKCASTKVRMDTFHCTSLCNKLCKENTVNNKPYPKTLLGKMLYYPGLTSSEKELIKDYPQEALIVFIQKERAEAKTEKLFPNGSLNDESDAFRHFIWAGLITKELGEEKAKLFLDAHENDPRQSPAEKGMDLANNRAGILSALILKKQNHLNLEELVMSALEELKNNQLSVLKPNPLINVREIRK